MIGRPWTDLLDKHVFDGVLMDCQMPVMAGCTASLVIRVESRFQEPPLLAMTADVMANDREKVTQAGKNDHIGKPVNVNEIFITMAKWITPNNNQKDTNIPATDASGGIPPELSELPGVDVAAGLAIVRGNLKLYSRLLSVFLGNYRTFETDFRAAQSNADDPQAALRAAHSLKSAAGSIGARSIQEKAKQLEFACRENKQNIDELVTAVVSDLQPLIEDLSNLPG